MVRNGKPLSPAEWARARDMVVAGYGIRAAARAIGVHHQTLLYRAKRENWYRPDKQVESMPPPPPPRPPKADQAGPAQLGGGKAPPDPAGFAEDLLYYRALIRWATEGLATLARFTPNVQMWLVEKLPNAIKALSAAEMARQPVQPEDLVARFEARVREISRPPSRPADIGETPPDAEGGE